MFIVQRSSHNPLIQPRLSYSWEDIATCNGCPIEHDGVLHMLYRAIAEPDRMVAPDLTQSSIGHAVSFDDIHFQNRTQFIYPEKEWEQFGCEDPRVTYMDGTYYIFYTALGVYPPRAEGIKVAVATTQDFKTIDEKHLVTPFNAKAMTLFPEKINGKYTVLFTLHSDSPPSSLRFAYVDALEQFWDPSFWDSWYSQASSQPELSFRRNDQDHVEIGAPPVLTDKGWLLVYSHIQDYFTDKPVFGIEVALLDRHNPEKVLARTSHPILVPEEMYERYGHINNITFPTGALVRDGVLEIYYGGADTTCCRADVNLEHLLDALVDPGYLVQRSPANPILSPTSHSWESRDVFNPAAIDLDGSVHVVYRAMSDDNTSVFGYARLDDGLTVDERIDSPIYTPRSEFEQKKGSPTGNSGCEDPRITQIDDTLYIFYTAYNGVHVPRVAVSSISENDFVSHRWNWSEPVLLTPEGIDDKDACLMSRKIFGEYAVIHRVAHHICLDFLPSLDFSKNKVKKCIEIFGPRRGMWDGVKVGIAGPPHDTKHGWLLFYHGVSQDSVYRVGAILLDREQPMHVLARTTLPLFEPKEFYELEGEIPNVVFPCGSVIRDDTVYLYYGGADKVVGVATLPLSRLFEILGITR